MSHLAKPEEPRLKSGKTPNESRRASCVSLDSNLNKEEKLIVQQSLEDQSLPPNENLLQQSRHNRAFSMPHIIPEPLSDISEKSTEASSVHRFLSVDNESPNEEKKKIPHSVPSSPQKIYGHNLDPNIDYNRPKSEAAVVKPQTGRKASVAFMEPSTSVDGSRDGDHEPEQQQQQQQTLRPQSRLQVEQSKDESRQSSAVSRPISSNSASPIGDVPYVYSPAEQMPLISLPPATNGESNKGLTRSQSKSSDEPPEQETLKKDAQTQKDESDLSSCTTSTPDIKPKDSRVIVSKVPVSRTPGVRRKPMIPVKQRTARSISPRPRRPTHQIIRVQPAIQPNANIRHILENVARTEGPFEQPDEALKAAMATFTQDAWTTKVEGMLAITRLATFHPTVLYKDIHTIVLALVYEVKNLRSSVSRSAIFTLGDLFIKLKKLIEPDMEIICQALLQKCGENVAFIRDDIDKALSNMIEEMPQTKSALALVHSGASHRNMNVRRTAAQFLETLVERMGATKCLMGPRDLGENLLPAAARFVMDGSPQTRYYGRRIFSVLMQHPLFDRLLRRHISPGTYRNIHGILESIKRRGVGEKPADVMATKS